MPPDTLAGYTDAELTAFYGQAVATDNAEWAQILEAECERRDRADRAERAERAERAARVHEKAAEVRRKVRARRLQDPLRLAWEEQAYAQYRAAEEACCGSLLSHAGDKAADVIAERLGKHDQALSTWPWPRLWTGPQWEADLYASEELRRYWADHPRLTFTQYREQLKQQEEWHRNDQLDRDERSAIQRGASQGQGGARVRGDGRGDDVPGPAARSAGQAGHVAGSATGAGRHVRPATGGDNMIGHLVVDAARMAAKADRAATRADINRRTNEIRAGRPDPGAAVAVRAVGAVAHRAGPPVDPQLVLGYTRAMLAEYASFPSPAALDAVTLWACHAHIRDDDGRLAFRATPRLLLMSSRPGSGKSRVLELLGRLCPYTYGLDTEPTAAGLAHTLDKEHATALIDEADVLFGAGKRKEAVRAVVNSGYTSNGTVLRMKGSHAERARVFGPMALAGLDVLEKSSGNALDATLDRCIIVRMVKSHGHVADLNAKADRAGALLKGALTAWAQSAGGEITDAEPDLPAGVHGRMAQIWTPLVAIADHAGGDWPDRARAACAEHAQAGYLGTNVVAGAMDELASMFAGEDDEIWTEGDETDE